MMHSAPIVKLTGAKVVVTKGEAQITLPVREDFFHAAGAMHGALYFLALDNAAFFAVNSLVEDVFVLTISFTSRHCPSCIGRHSRGSRKGRLSESHSVYRRVSSL